MIPADLLGACPHRQFQTLPGLLDIRAALSDSNPNALLAMQGGSLYHFYDGLRYDPAGHASRNEERIICLTYITPHGATIIGHTLSPCRFGSVGSVSASRTVGREFASRPGHTKDHHKNGTNCLPA